MRVFGNVLSWWVLICAVFAGSARGAEEGAGGVRVEKGKVKVEYKSFDPKKLPDPPPPLKGEEAAVCVYQFGVGSNVRYGYQAPARGGGGEEVASAVNISGLEVQVSLSIVIWLPNHANAQLKAHEEGHRTIAEHYYKTAERVAREHARKVVGRRVAIKAKNVEGAAKAEIEKVNTELCNTIMKAIEGPCGKAQDVYDEMTDHGRKVKPTSEEAVKLAVERVGKGK